MFAMFIVSDPTEIQGRMETVILPSIAAVLALVASAGLVVSRWLRRHARGALLAFAVAGPGFLVLTVAFYAWASRLSYGFLGFLGIAILLLLLYLAVETALFAFLPALGNAAAGEAPEPRLDRRLLPLAPLPPVAAFVLAIPGLLSDEANAVAAMAIFLVLAVLCLVVPILAAARISRGLRRRGASRGARRLGRTGWLFVAAVPTTALLLVGANLLPTLGSDSSFRAAVTLLLGALALVPIVLFPPLAISLSAAALLRAAKERPAEKPPAAEAPPEPEPSAPPAP